MRIAFGMAVEISSRANPRESLSLAGNGGLHGEAVRGLQPLRNPREARHHQ